MEYSPEALIKVSEDLAADNDRLDEHQLELAELRNEVKALRAEIGTMEDDEIIGLTAKEAESIGSIGFINGIDETDLCRRIKEALDNAARREEKLPNEHGPVTGS